MPCLSFGTGPAARRVVQSTDLDATATPMREYGISVRASRTPQQHRKGKRYDTADLDDDETVKLTERTFLVSPKARLDRAFLSCAALSRQNRIMAGMLGPRKSAGRIEKEPSC